MMQISRKYYYLMRLVMAKVTTSFSLDTKIIKNKVIIYQFIRGSQISRCTNYYQEAKYTNTEPLFKIYEKFSEKISKIIGLTFSSQLVNEQKYLKIKSYNSKIITSICDTKCLKKVAIVCLAVIALDSVCKIKTNYYAEVYIEQDKYEENQRKKNRYITE